MQTIDKAEVEAQEKQIRNKFDELYQTIGLFLTDMQVLKESDLFKALENFESLKKAKEQKLKQIFKNPKIFQDLKDSEVLKDEKIHKELVDILKPFTRNFQCELKHPFPPQANTKYDIEIAKSQVIEQLSSDNFKVFFNHLEEGTLSYYKFIEFFKKNPDLAEVIKDQAFFVDVERRLDLPAFLIKPAQHMQRYGLFLKELNDEFTKLTHEEQTELKELLKKIQAYCVTVNEHKGAKELQEASKDLAVEVKGLKRLINKVKNPSKTKDEALLFDSKDFVKKLFYFDDNGIHHPFNSKTDLSTLYKLIEKDSKFAAFRKFLSENKIEILDLTNIDLKLMLNKFQEAVAEHPNRAAIWLGLIIISKNAQPGDLINAWAKIKDLCKDNNFAFHDNAGFIENIFKQLIKAGTQLENGQSSLRADLNAKSSQKERLEAEYEKLKKQLQEENQAASIAIDSKNALITKLSTEKQTALTQLQQLDEQKNKLQTELHNALAANDGTGIAQGGDRQRQQQKITVLTTKMEELDKNLLSTTKRLAEVTAEKQAIEQRLVAITAAQQPNQAINRPPIPLPQPPAAVVQVAARPWAQAEIKQPKATESKWRKVGKYILFGALIAIGIGLLLTGVLAWVGVIEIAAVVGIAGISLGVANIGIGSSLTAIEATKNDKADAQQPPEAPAAGMGHADMLQNMGGVNAAAVNPVDPGQVQARGDNLPPLQPPQAKAGQVEPEAPADVHINQSKLG